MNNDEMLRLKVKDFYTANNYPNLTHYTPYKLNEMCSPFAPPYLELKENILVIGCGVIEANLVAFHQPKSEVIGVDFSKPSISISKSIRRKFRIKNLKHVVGDFFTQDYTDVLFDRIIATGVLHHMPNINEAVQKIDKILSPNGIFCGMVYSDKRPERIRMLNKFFLNQKYTVEQVKNYLTIVKDPWYMAHDKSDVEVSDTWLNPHFNEYSKKELSDILSKNGFSENKVVYDGFEDCKILFSAWR